jgi:hypothetical protein
MGLGELAETAMKVVEAYGRKSEEELAELALKKLGLEGDVKALAFNVDLNAYLDFRRRLKETLKKQNAQTKSKNSPTSSAMFKNVHLFADTSVLARIVYAVAATRVSKRPKPLVEIAMEQGLVIYIDKAVDRELPDALKNILKSVDRARHGWPHLDVESMFNIALTAYSDLAQSRHIRIVEDGGALARQRRALESRETRRVCWSEKVNEYTTVPRRIS